MKDVALIAVNLKEDYSGCNNAATAVENSLAFLDKIDSVAQDTDEVIFGTFPVLLVGDYSEKLRPYASDGLTFRMDDKEILESENDGGQSVAEVLDLLDIQNVYVCGMSAGKEIRNLCTSLQAAGLKLIVLKDCLGYPSIESYSRFISELESHGIKTTDK